MASIVFKNTIINATKVSQNFDKIKCGTIRMNFPQKLPKARNYNLLCLGRRRRRFMAQIRGKFKEQYQRCAVIVAGKREQANDEKRGDLPWHCGSCRGSWWSLGPFPAEHGRKRNAGELSVQIGFDPDSRLHERVPWNVRVKEPATWSGGSNSTRYDFKHWPIAPRTDSNSHQSLAARNSINRAKFPN